MRMKNCFFFSISFSIFFYSYYPREIDSFIRINMSRKINDDYKGTRKTVNMSRFAYGKHNSVSFLQGLSSVNREYLAWISRCKNKLRRKKKKTEPCLARETYSLTLKDRSPTKVAKNSLNVYPNYYFKIWLLFWSQFM